MKSSLTFNIFVGLALGLLVVGPAAAADSLPGLMEQFETITKSVNSKLIFPAMATAGAAVTLNWIFTFGKEIFSGTLSSSLGKVVGGITWFGATYWLLSNQEMLSSMFSSYLDLAGNVAGAGAGSGKSGMNPGDIIVNGILVILKVNWAVTKAAATGATSDLPGVIGSISTAVQNLNPFAHLGVAIMLVFSQIFIFICFLMVALSVFVAKIEFWLLFAVAPLALALIPLPALRDQGLAPLKGIVSVGLRLLILGVIVAVANSFAQTIMTALAAGLPPDEYLFAPVWTYMSGMAACAVMAMYAGKIASSIASGSASFSGADVMKGAAIPAVAAVAVAAPAAIGAMKAASGSAANAGKSAVKGISSAFSNGSLDVRPSSTGSGGQQPIGGPLSDPMKKSTSSSGGVGQGSSNRPQQTSPVASEAPGAPGAPSGTMTSDGNASIGGSSNKPSSATQPTSGGGMRNTLGQRAENAFTADEGNAVSITINSGNQD